MDHGGQVFLFLFLFRTVVTDLGSGYIWFIFCIRVVSFCLQALVLFLGGMFHDFYV